ncbi:MAG: non-hydrolyzing UDP-N-acetylglucosamine 2-epimerase [Candidatus Hodarchaeota archaeon]
MKIASIIGTRPQFIKAAALSPELRKDTNEVLIHTGQHYDYEMNQAFFDALNIPKPNYNLGIGSGSHGRQTGLMLTAIEEVLMKESPDMVLVYGDTNSTLAGALAASKLNISIAHVEAGLRSYNRSMPEEINRILVDHLSNLLFAPTKKSVENLKKEGIEKGIHLVGDVMYDIALRSQSIAKMNNISEKLKLEKKSYILATIHRPANTDNDVNLRNILESLYECGKSVVFPIHPRTIKAIKKFGLPFSSNEGNVKFINPVNYIEFLKLLMDANKVVTDSGGVQKEAYFFRIPCITLRDETEWYETVEKGWNILVGARKDAIIDAIKNFKHSSNLTVNFGDGDASKWITKIIIDEFVKR